jgi:hypothetical protein
MNDKSFFEGAIDKIQNIGESLGVKINVKSRWILKTGLIIISIVFIGIFIFLGALIKNSFRKKK